METKHLTADEARQIMSNEKATKLVEYILSGVPARAKKGLYDITVRCSDGAYSGDDIEAAEAQLKELGYNINYVYGYNSVLFFVNWRE